MNIRYILVWVIIVALAVAGVFYDVSSKKTLMASNQLHLVKLVDVESSDLIPLHAGAGSFSLPLRMDDSKSKEVVTKIIAWLNSSKVVGEAKNEFVSFGSNPTELRLKLRNNTFILIEDAVDGVSTKLDNGIQVQSKPVRDQVTLVQSGKEAIRINSPELKTWIQKGWSEEDVLKFTQKDAIAKVLKMKTEFPASPDQVKTMFEDVGGVQGSKVEVKLTTKVEELGMMEYVIALTKNYQLKVGGNDVVTYWKYHVNPSRATLIDSKNEMPAIK